MEAGERSGFVIVIIIIGIIISFGLVVHTVGEVEDEEVGGVEEEG
jgi:hypothetical protein